MKTLIDGAERSRLKRLIPCWVAAAVICGLGHEMAAAGPLPEKFNEDWDFAEEVHRTLYATSENQLAVCAWRMDREAMMLPLNELVARARARISPPRGSKGQPFLLDRLEWRRSGSYGGPSYVGPFWIMRCWFRRPATDSRWQTDFTVRGAGPEVYVLPNGGKVTVKERPLTDQEWAGSGSSPKAQLSRPKGMARFVSSMIPPKDATASTRAFAEVRDLETRTAATLSGSVQDMSQTQAWDLERDDEPQPIAKLIQKAASHVPRDSAHKNYLLDLAGVDWQRHGGDATPVWTVTVHHMLSPDRSKPENAMTRDGESFFDETFFPNGGTIDTQSRPMKEEEQKTFGLKPRSSSRENSQATVPGQ
jgi:hypothetical protein